MQNVLIVFFIASFVLMILVFPFKTRIMAHINFLEYKCFYSAKIWIIKILCGKASIENEEVKIENENTIFSGKYDKNFKTTAFEILKRINVKKVELFFTGGFSENSFSSAIMCGSVLSFVETLYAHLSMTYDDVKMYKDIEPTFKEDNLELTLDFVASISVIQLIVAVIKAKKQLKNLERSKAWKKSILEIK